MSDPLGELSQVEIDLVIKHRQQANRTTSINQYVLTALTIAAGYEKWLQENQRGSSFSTFHDEYGCEGNGSSAMFKVVESLRMTAQTNVVNAFF